VYEPLDQPTGAGRRGITGKLLIVLAVAGAAVASVALLSARHHSPVAPPNGLAHKSASQIIASAERALSLVHSFHFEGVEVVQRTGTVELTGDIAVPSRFRIQISQGNQTAAVISINGTAYMMANTPFWAARAKTTTDAAAVNLLANRWILVPPRVAGSAFGSMAAWSNPATFAKCVIGQHDTLTVAGTAIEGSQPVVIIRDNGNAPGDSPGETYIATTGPPLPVRATQTGPHRAGGDVACGKGTAGRDTTKSGDLRLSRFNRPVQITAPRNALVLPGWGTRAQLGSDPAASMNSG
jgi:hypothetical protein